MSALPFFPPVVLTELREHCKNLCECSVIHSNLPATVSTFTNLWHRDPTSVTPPQIYGTVTPPQCAARSLCCPMMPPDWKPFLSVEIELQLSNCHL